jgi:cysteine-rich repeat protein
MRPIPLTEAPMSLSSRALILAASLVLAIPPSPGGAQVVVDPALAVPAPAGGVSQVDVAATYSGRYVLTATRDTGELLVQRLFDHQWEPGHAVNFAGPAGEPMLRLDLHGNLTAGWQDPFGLELRYLDSAGFPSGSSPVTINHDDFMNGSMRIGALGTGVAIVWSESGPGGVVLRAQIGTRRFTVVGAVGPLQWDADALPSGGGLIAWHQFSGTVGAMKAQRYHADGTELGVPMELDMSVLTLGTAAVSPAGDAFAVAGVRETSTFRQYEVRARRFTITGTPLGPELVVAIASDPLATQPQVVLPNVRFDFAGNLYVAWGDAADATAGIYVRAYDPAGVPFGAALQIANEAPAQAVSAARLPDGRFANAWTLRDHTAWTTLVSLCPSGAAVCGDGVLHPACERCDDGAANDDAASDACRTDCLPAHCGDGTVDAGEACDDGNFAYCDGCTPSCQIETGVVCGDGVTSRQCGEQCDDANLELLDGCTPACTVEHIPGGGPSVTECYSEWSVENPTNVPPRDVHGAIVRKQRCVDDDARCDFDGGLAGSCTFHLRVCGNDTDVAGCFAPPRLADWQLDRPSASQAAKRPALLQVRDALVPAVSSAIVGTTDRDACSDVLSVVVPLRGKPGRYGIGSLTLKAHATSYAGAVDKDKLLLQCVPH